MREKKEQFAAEDRPGLKYDSEYDQLLDFDPNVITPGTEFISNFSKAIQVIISIFLVGIISFDGYLNICYF
jgi:5'-3' exonuclease